MTTRPALVVLLTAQDDVDASRGFLGTLPAMTARAQVVVGTVTDHAEDRPAREDAVEVYLAAARERGAFEASRVAEAIRRAGGDAIADGPDALPPRIADRYLALKAAGRL